MNRYIRTEDRIYETTDNLIIKDNQLYEKEFSSSYFDTKEIYLRDVFLGKIIAEADTIEELCDEFVLAERNSKPRIFTTLKGAINNKIYDDEDIYGAIWTDKGLIYVAKMNNDGELELI